ncbi:MAG: exopolysaccharide biosynthesis polyprenyl glycosylphosphotransferase [Cyclobacteriaceae bacterium]
MLLDVVLILLLLDLALYLQWWHPTFSKETFAMLPIIFSLSWVLSGVLFAIYQIENLGGYRSILSYIAKASVLHIVLICSLIGLRGNLFDHLWDLLFYFSVTLGAITLTRFLLLRFYRWYRSLPFNRKNTIIIGCGPKGIELYTYFRENRSLPQRVKGFFDAQASQHPLIKNLYKGDLHEVQSFCLEHGIQEIYYTLPNHRTYLRDLQDFAERHFIYLGIIPDHESDKRKRVHAQLFNRGRIPVISYRNSPLRLIVNAILKRAFDIVFASLALGVLSLTLFPIIAIAIRWDSPGPVFFKQPRMGLKNTLFYCYKFRTMYVNNEQDRQASKDDKRITRVGTFLRRSSFDELPQFINVLKGDMSVVGPRPQIQQQLQYYSELIGDYPIRASIAPGITGYAQVNGYRGETREVIQMAKRIEYDLIYMQEWSLMLDIRIIWLTIKNMIKGEENAY